MINSLSIVFFILYASIAYGQAGQKTAKDMILDFQNTAVESGEVKQEHVLVINGEVIQPSQVIIESLNGIYPSSIDTLFTLTSIKARKHFDGPARNGMLLIRFDKRGYKKFQKNRKRLLRKSEN